jgi:hypothetical protein
MKKALYILLFLPLLASGQNNISIDLQEGWGIFGYGCQDPIDVIDGLTNYENVIVLVKNYSGGAYLPEWGFNGIGNLEPGYGYQIKTIENIPEFTLCNGNEGNIADLQAELDSLYSHGCMDSLACNFDVNHIYNDFSCVYPELGYDCQGNVAEYIIGMEVEGGIVFYVDETGQHGLVAAMVDLGPFEWGCNDLSILGADEQSIGSGLQNTQEIGNQCTETPIASSEALAYESEDFTDWYLPSYDELQEMYYSIGQGSSNGNKGNFSNSWYWASSQANTDIAWSFSFTNGTTFNFYKSSVFMIRPVRTF